MTPKAQLDRALALACGIAAGIAALLASAWIGPFVLYREFDNLYFQADCALVYSNMTERLANHYRTGMHPMFSVLMWPAVAVLQGLGLEALTAVRTLLCLNAGAMAALAFLVLRRCGLRAPDAGLFALSLAGSVAVLFFGSVPETFAFGGTTILVMLWVITVERPGLRALVLGNVATMSMTLTNFMVGVAATFRTDPADRRKALKAWGIAGAVVAAFGVLSKLVFRSSGYAGDFRRYVQWVRTPELGDVRSFFVHGTVMPAPMFRAQDIGVLEAVAEPSRVGSGGTLGLLAALGWLALLGAGLYAAVTRAEDRRLRDVLLLATAGQLALHLCFADGPFLFSAHFTPLLLLLAAHALLLPLPKWPLRLAAGAVLLAVGVNNVAQHRSMVARFEQEVLPWLAQHGTARFVGATLPNDGRAR